MGKQALDAARTNLYIVEPDQLTIITDPAHPLYDERTKLPLDEQLVKNIMVYGVKVPVLVRKNGEAIEVVDGRQRVRAAIEANKRLGEEGGLAVKVRVVLEKGDDAELVGVGILTNELRQGDGVLTKARKAKRLLDIDPDLDKCALIFGVTKVQLNRWLKLLDLDPKVQEAVEKEDITPMAAVALADLSREKQLAELKSLKEEEASSGKKLTVGKARRAARRAAGGDAKHERPSVKVLQRLYKAPEVDDEDRQLIGWILGEVGEKDVGIDVILAEIDKREELEADRDVALKKAERDAAAAEKKEAAEAKKRAKAEAKAAKKAERDAKKLVKKEAAQAKKEAAKQRRAEKKATKVAAVAAKKEAAKQKRVDRKTAKEAVAAAKKEAKAEAKREKAEQRAALKQALADKKAEIMAKQAAKSAKR